jgi:hypothetical protein
MIIVSDTRILVTIDERARLVMALLAASGWPEREQAEQAHAVHFHSKQTRQYVRHSSDHQAVILLDQLLDGGLSLAELFTAVLRCRWPELVPTEPLPGPLIDESWLRATAEFYEDSALGSFWAEHQDPWHEAQKDLTAIFQDSQIIRFLSQLLDQPLSRSIMVVPSVVYPMLNPVMAETNRSVFFILPPAKAWGESPPWPFGEDPGWVIAQSCWHLSAYFMADTLSRLDEKNQALLRHAAVTLCLEQEFDEAEAMAYLVRSRKEHNLPQLSLVTEDLREYLAMPESHSLLDIVP